MYMGLTDAAYPMWRVASVAMCWMIAFLFGKADVEAVTELQQQNEQLAASMDEKAPFGRAAESSWSTQGDKRQNTEIWQWVKTNGTILG